MPDSHIGLSDRFVLLMFHMRDSANAVSSLHPAGRDAVSWSLTTSAEAMRLRTGACTLHLLVHESETTSKVLSSCRCWWLPAPACGWWTPTRRWTRG